MSRSILCVPLAVFAVACGGGGSSNDDVTSSIAAVPTSVAARIECVGEAMLNNFDYEEGRQGAESIEAAIDGWTFDGGAPYLRYDLRAVIDEPSGTANLVDEAGLVRIVLSVRDYGNGWLVESSERCVDS